MMFRVIFATLMTFTVVLSKLQLDKDAIEKLLSVMTKIKCEKPVSTNKSKPAFFATLSKVVNNLGKNEVLKFDNVKTNIGNGYDASSGVFTAPNIGTYEFSANFISNGDGWLELNLMKNDEFIVKGHCSTAHGTSGSIQAILKLKKGDGVYVRQPRTSGSIIGENYTMFSGHMI